MTASKPSNQPTVDQRMALLEQSSMEQARQIRALLEDNNRMSASIERLHGRLDEQRRWVRGEVDEKLLEQREWLAEGIAKAEERIIARQGFDRIGRLRKEIEEGADFVFKELRRLREQAVTFSEGLKRTEEGFASLFGLVEGVHHRMSEIDEAWPVVETVINRADKGVDDISQVLGMAAWKKERVPLVIAVEMLEHQVGSGQGRLTVLERQFRDILNRFATGRSLPSNPGEPPVVAAPSDRLDSVFPADGLVKVVMGEIGGKACPVVEARELHGFLEVETRFNDWISRRITEYEFEENQDFAIDYSNLSNQTNPSQVKSVRGGNRRSKGYIISLDMAKELGVVENNPKGRQVRRYFINCEKRLHEILSRSAQPPAIPANSEVAPAVDSAERMVVPEEPLPIHYYTAADPLFMACIVLAEGAVTEEGDMGEWISRRTFRPTNGMLMRNAKALAYLLRNAPRSGQGLRYTQYELAMQADLTASHLRESLGYLKALEFVVIKRLSKGRPGPTFELFVLWENIEAAAIRDGVDLAALGALPVSTLDLMGG